MATVGDSGISLVECKRKSEWTYHTLETRTIARPSQVAHRPDSRPESNDVVDTGKYNTSLDQSASEAKLVPGRQHASLVVQPVRLLLGQSDLQATIPSRDCGGVVPFEVVGLPIVEVDGFPVRVVTGVEGPAVSVELVGPDELPALFSHVVLFGVCLPGRIQVNQAPVPRHGGNLKILSMKFPNMRASGLTCPLALIPPRLNPPSVDGVCFVKWLMMGYPALHEPVRAGLASRKAWAHKRASSPTIKTMRHPRLVRAR